MKFFQVVGSVRMVTLLLGVIVASSAQAAEWAEFGTLHDGNTIVAVDEKSVVIEHDKLVKGWVKFDYFSAKSVLGNKLSGHVSYRMANCETGKHWIVEDWGHPATSAEQVSLLVGANEWSFPAPGSESALAMDALCYQTRSMFGVMWDKIKANYQRVKAEQAEQKK